MSLELAVVAGPDKGRTFTLNVGKDLILGRSAQAHYQINDPRASRNHCVVALEGDQVSVACNGGSALCSAAQRCRLVVARFQVKVSPRNLMPR